MSFINATTDKQTLKDMKALSKYKEFINKLLYSNTENFFTCELGMCSVNGAIRWAKEKGFITKKGIIECDIENCDEDIITVELVEWHIHYLALKAWIEATITNNKIMLAWAEHDFPTCC